jgi:hypothetical protein
LIVTIAEPEAMVAAHQVVTSPTIDKVIVAAASKPEPEAKSTATIWQQVKRLKQGEVFARKESGDDERGAHWAGIQWPETNIRQRQISKTMTTIHRLLTTLLVGLTTAGAVSASINPADSLVIRFANRTRMVIYAPDKAGIQALSNYDLNKLSVKWGCSSTQCRADKSHLAGRRSIFKRYGIGGEEEERRRNHYY